jgi:hypothetical protein
MERDAIDRDDARVLQTELGTQAVDVEDSAHRARLNPSIRCGVLPV